MVSSPCRKAFPLFMTFAALFLSLALWPRADLRAQAACGNQGNNCFNPATGGPDDSLCDDGNACNGAEFCQRVGSDVIQDLCACGTPPGDGTACSDDGTFCNGNEVCSGGTCSGHTGDPCKANPDVCNDTCNEKAHNCLSPNGTVCDDTVNCTTGDVCTAGACAGTPIQCSDGISCTVDACDEPTGLCQFDASKCPCQTDADCNDGNVCTDEFCCTSGACFQDPNLALTCIRSNNSNPCDDGLFCNGPDTCQGGTCSIHSGDPCVGGGQCAETCDEAGNTCFAAKGAACSDSSDLTTTQCDGAGACIVIQTASTQGSRLGCSLDPEGSASFGLVSWSGMMALIAGFVMRRSLVIK